MTDEKKKRGFALLSAERMREVAAMGGAAVKPEQRSFSRMSREQLSELGRKGGTATAASGRRNSFSDRPREEAQEAGRKGGLSPMARHLSSEKAKEMARKSHANRWGKKTG